MKLIPTYSGPRGGGRWGGSWGQIPPDSPQVDAEGSGLLGFFTGCDFPPLTVFHAAPWGSGAGGDGEHVTVTILICWGTVGRRGAHLQVPRPGVDAEPRALVWGLLGAGTGVAGG